MTYRKRPEKYFVKWERKKRRKFRRIERAFMRSQESWRWWYRRKHDVSTEQGFEAFLADIWQRRHSQRKITKRYYANRKYERSK